MPTSAKLTGVIIGVAGSFQNKGSTRDKAFDNDLNTFFDAPQASLGWIGLDFGTPQQISQISYAPRVGFANRMIGAVFQGWNKPDRSDAVVLATIKVAPPAMVLTTIPIADQGRYRYAGLTGAAGSYCNVSEIQFFGPAPAPTVIVVAPAPSTYPQDSAGWSIPRAATVSYFVDPVNGSDSNPANTQSKPHKTPAPFLKAQPANAALLFNAGSTSAPAMGWVKAPGLYIGRYGNPTAPDPIIQVPGGAEFFKAVGPDCLVQCLTLEGDGTNKGIETSGTNFRAEGVSVTNFFQGVLPAGGTGCVWFRCNISHNHNAVGHGGHACGVYSDYTAQLTLAECVLSLNGWDGVNPATSDEFSHGAYCDDDTKNPFNPIQIIRSIVANNSGWGVEGRPGGTADDNLLIDNGLHGGGLFLGGTNSEIKNNVCTGALDSPARSTGRGDGLLLESLNGSLHHNLAVNPRGSTGAAFGISTTTSNGLPMNTGSVDVYANQSIGWSGIGMAFYSTRKLVNFYQNKLDCDGVAIYYHVPPTTLTAKDNAYRPGALFQTGDKGKISWCDWWVKVGETGAGVAPNSCSATIENYATANGLSPSGQALLGRAELNCNRANYDQRFIASSINDYFRAAVGMSRG